MEVPNSLGATTKTLNDSEEGVCKERVGLASDELRRIAAGAGRGSRTPKGRSPADFESAASASSAIPALVEVPDSRGYFAFYIFFVHDSKCETVQVNVKVFTDFHRSLSLAHAAPCGSSRATMSLGQAITRTSVEILPPNAVIAPSLNDDPPLFGPVRARVPFRSHCGHCNG